MGRAVIRDNAGSQLMGALQPFCAASYALMLSCNSTVTRSRILSGPSKRPLPFPSGARRDSRRAKGEEREPEAGWPKAVISGAPAKACEDRQARCLWRRRSQLLARQAPQNQHVRSAIKHRDQLWAEACFATSVGDTGTRTSARTSNRTKRPHRRNGSHQGWVLVPGAR